MHVRKGRRGSEASVGPRFLMSRAPSDRRPEDVDETAKASDARVHPFVLCPSRCVGRARVRAARAALRMGPFPAAILRRHFSAASHFQPPRTSHPSSRSRPLIMSLKHAWLRSLAATIASRPLATTFLASFRAPGLRASSVTAFSAVLPPKRSVVLALVLLCFSNLKPSSQGISRLAAAHLSWWCSQCLRLCDGAASLRFTDPIDRYRGQAIKSRSYFPVRDAGSASQA